MAHSVCESTDDFLGSGGCSSRYEEGGIGIGFEQELNDWDGGDCFASRDRVYPNAAMGNSF